MACFNVININDPVGTPAGTRCPHSVWVNCHKRELDNISISFQRPSLLNNWDLLNMQWPRLFMWHRHRDSGVTMKETWLEGWFAAGKLQIEQWKKITPERLLRSQHTVNFRITSCDGTRKPCNQAVRNSSCCSEGTIGCNKAFVWLNDVAPPTTLQTRGWMPFQFWFNSHIFTEHPSPNNK